MNSSAHDSQEFQNDNLSLQLKKDSGCRIQLSITVAPKGVKAAYAKAMKQVAKEVSIPGFRKGRVPDSVLMQNYKPAIEREWRQVLLETAFR